MQEQLLRMKLAMMPVDELNQACWDLFGEGMIQVSYGPPLEPHLRPAEIVEDAGDRAKAIHYYNNGETLELHLVKIEGRWWISCYTLEYDPELDLNNVPVDQAARALECLGAVAPAVAEEIRSPEFQENGNPRIVLRRLYDYALTEFPEAEEDLRALMTGGRD